jgi:glycosyltransferase involved in cell wall biosynthesis
VSDPYRFPNIEGSVYSNVVDLVRAHRTSSGKVVLDLGCGFGPIAEPMRDLGLSYVGIDDDGRGVQDLTDRGFEAIEGNLSDPGLFSRLVESVLDGRPLAAIAALGLLERVTNGPALLELLSALSLANGCPPLVVAVANATHIDIAAKMLIGRLDYTVTGLLGDRQVVFYSPAHLDAVMARSGWRETGREDFELSRSDQNFPANVPVLTAGTPIHRLLLELRDQATEGAIVNQFVRAYTPVETVTMEVTDDPSTTPFLSVLVRTQGRRSSTIIETLVSLAAQTLQDFEVLILAHDVDTAGTEDLRQLVESFDRDFAECVRIVRVEGAGRARPLNVGVRQARGAYVAVLDDDDIAFAHWVEEFHRAASEGPGSVVRAVVAEQLVEWVPWGSSSGYTTRESASIPFPTRFDLWEHMFEDPSPFSGYAFPRSCFTDMGVRFDETLEVAEGWDFILRAALLCGVTSCSDVTSLYRCWQSPHSPLTSRSRDEWNRDRDEVLARLDRQTLPMPPRAVSNVRRLYEEVQMSRELVDRLVSERDVARDASSGRTEELAERLHVAAMERNLAIAQAERTQLEIERIQESVSWRVTRPVRGLRRAVNRLKRGNRSDS